MQIGQSKTNKWANRPSWLIPTKSGTPESYYMCPIWLALFMVIIFLGKMDKVKIISGQTNRPGRF